MKKTGIFVFGLLLLAALPACKKEKNGPVLFSDVPEGAQAVSLLGEPLYPPAPSERAIRQLEEAEQNYEADPDDPDNIIWWGRRTAYTGDYRAAIKIYSEGIEKFPKNPRFFRHRGHRYISIREFDRAVEDFEEAAALIAGQEDRVEPDGQPNAQNIPVSSLHTNIWYHLGLAYYLKNDLENALRAFEQGLHASANDDMLIAMMHWYYMSLRLLGRQEAAQAVLAPVQAEMNIIENSAYHRLCLLYKGEISVEELTGDESSEPANDALLYGVGNWHFYNGQKDEAREVFDRIIANKIWASFGHIAAESQLAREFSTGDKIKRE